jgi:uncharacterized protein (UPF0305 family)
MERHADKFVPLGEIATIRFGVKSGCDAFFMPRDCSQEFLEKYSKLDWNSAPLMTHCKRAEVESGELKLVRAGNGTVHPIEAKYLAPEVHSLMNVSRPVISAADLDRLILQVSEPMSKLKGTHVLKYLRYGETNSFASTKSKAVPVPQRSTCAARDPWYDLTYTKPGAFFWPMAQQYRHIIPANPENLICNHNLFDVHPYELDAQAVSVLTAVANSTLVANFKTFYGRYAGTEGNLKTEVVDVNLLVIPDPRHATKAVAEKLRKAFAQLCQRTVGGMVEEGFMECRTPARSKKLAERKIQLPEELRQRDRRDLDLTVFELLGVADEREREELVDELYWETANHFRQIRIVEIQKQEQRSKNKEREFRTDELAADLWDGLEEEFKLPLAAWIGGNVTDESIFNIPEGKATLPDASDMLDATTVFVRPSAAGERAEPLRLPSRTHAETVHLLMQRGLHGKLPLPKSEAAAREFQKQLTERLAALASKADELARSRTGDEKRASDLARLLESWMIHGKPRREPKAEENPEDRT